MRRAKTAAGALCALMVAAAAGCGGDDDPGTGGAPDAAADPPGPCFSSQEPCVYEHTFPAVTLQGGEELEPCQSWTLNNPEELWVTRVEAENAGMYHHSNWFFVPDDTYEIPDGVWDCSEHGFDELTAAILGGYVFAQSTQVTAEEQILPPDTAVRIPPWSRVIGSTHLLNTSDQVVETSYRLQLDSRPESELAIKLTPARIEYRDLHIAPRATSEFVTECDLAASHEDVLGEPLRYDIYYVFAHYHELGIYAEWAYAGGPRDGEVFHRHEGYGEAFGQAFDPPISLSEAGAHGVRFRCGFMNPRDDEVQWGIGDQEMCVAQFFADTRLAFDGDVARGRGAVVGTLPDGTIQSAGPCSVLGIPWDHDKEGGPPR